MSGLRISAFVVLRVNHTDLLSLVIFDYSSNFAAVSHFKIKVVRFRLGRSSGQLYVEHL